MTKLNRITTTTASIGLCGLMSSGCFFQGYEGAFIEADDVSLDTPGQLSSRSFADGEQGDIYMVIEQTAVEVNGWVSETVQGIGTVVAFLNAHPETANDGPWRVYGPFNDDENRDLAWMAKVQGDASQTAYEVWVGARGASKDDMKLLLDGDITVGDELRTGGFTLYFDAVEAHAAMKDFEDAGVTFRGEIDVQFQRDIATENKNVDIDFRGFEAVSVLGESWTSEDTYVYHRADDGSGSFHLTVDGTFDDNAWGGIKTNKLILDARWDDDERGRTRGRITEVEHADSGLPDGELVIHECFDGTGDLTWRDINDAYADELPWYDEGEPTQCVYTEDDLGA